MSGNAGGAFFNRDQGGKSQVHGNIRQRAVDHGRLAGGLAVGIGATLLILTRQAARKILTLPPDRRRPLLDRPENHGLVSEDVQVLAEDGLALRGWYMPGSNGATIMVEHGTPGGRQDGLAEAAFLNKHGYNVLLGSLRAHDDSDGVDVSLGYHELKDITAWHRFLLERKDVDPARIGIFGESMGGAVAIHYAAEHPEIAAVAAASAPATMAEVVAHTLAAKSQIPGWSVKTLARLLVFWGERKVGCPLEEIAAEHYAGRISPRPLLIIQGGDEDRVPPEHGQRLYEAAGEPKEYWFVPEAGHVNFEEVVPEEYERRVLAFFDRYLLGQAEQG